MHKKLCFIFGTGIITEVIPFRIEIQHVNEKRFLMHAYVLSLSFLCLYYWCWIFLSVALPSLSFLLFYNSCILLDYISYSFGSWNSNDVLFLNSQMVTLLFLILLHLYILLPYVCFIFQELLLLLFSITVLLFSFLLLYYYSLKTFHFLSHFSNPFTFQYLILLYSNSISCPPIIYLSFFFNSLDFS